MCARGLPTHTHDDDGDRYDISGDGSLDVSELVHMLLCSKQHVNSAAAAVLRSLRTMDTDMNGHVTIEEFRARAMRDPEVLQAVFRCVWPAPAKTPPPVYTTIALYPSMGTDCRDGDTDAACRACAACST